MRSPLVSLCIPLHRSRRFLDILLENIEALSYPNLEILVSDRDLEDDTLEVLRARYGEDPRFRFFAARDRLDWVAHFNFLLGNARGKYFLWMAHDDSYPPNYVDELVQRLEAEPSAVLAFGRVEQVSLDGFLPTFPFAPPPVADDEAWSTDSSVRCLTLWHLWIAFRGLIRRDVVERNELLLRSTRGNVRADIYWVFALSLYGPLRYVSAVHCTKRFHRGSGGAGWRFGIRQSLDARRVLASYLDDHASSRREARRAKRIVSAWCLVQGFLPEKVARPLGVALRKVAVTPTSIHRRFDR